MLDLGLSNEGPHNMFIALGHLAADQCYCFSTFSDIDFQPDPADENVYWIHGTGFNSWEDPEGETATSEITGSFRKNIDGDVVFSGVFECICLNGESEHANSVVNIDDLIVVRSYNNHARAYDNKKDLFIEIA